MHTHKGKIRMYVTVVHRSEIVKVLRVQFQLCIVNYLRGRPVLRIFSARWKLAFSPGIDFSNPYTAQDPGRAIFSNPLPNIDKSPPHLWTIHKFHYTLHVPVHDSIYCFIYTRVRSVYLIFQISWNIKFSQSAESIIYYCQFTVVQLY